MFLYWEGYEIDGSDTDFDIVLPENRQAVEFVDCFLSIPLFSSKMKPIIYYYKKNKQIKISIQELRNRILSGDYPELFLNMNCLHIEELSADLTKKIYSISKTRDPLEKAYGKVENPCTAPVHQTGFSRGEMTVQLQIEQPGTKAGWYTEEDSRIEGYVNHPELIRSSDPALSCFTMNVGPSFYFEYAMYIMEYLKDSFPGLGTCGGLDCVGGWTDGCTYADSIYAYEKVQFPVIYSVKNTMKRLTEYNLVRSYRRCYKKSWIFEALNEFHLANKKDAKKPEDYNVSFTKYIELVEFALASLQDVFSTLCDTAINIMLPKPQEFLQNPIAVKRLEEVLIENDHDWIYTGYLAFSIVDGQPMYEFRVHWSMKPYLMVLLELVESKEIEFIKKVTYERRGGSNDSSKS